MWIGEITEQHLHAEPFIDHIWLFIDRKTLLNYFMTSTFKLY